MTETLTTTIAEYGVAASPEEQAAARVGAFAEQLVGMLGSATELLTIELGRRFGLYRTLHERGVRFAMLTNNVREWEPLWRTKLPVDEIFETVVDSGFVGLRKPDRAIYAIVLERLGLPAEECVFVDDLSVNIEAAQELGFAVVHFRDTEQAIAELDALLLEFSAGGS